MELMTRIIIRNDSTVNWSANDDQVLLKGEMGIEFTESGEPKIKIGDGVSTWAELKYFGGETAVQFFEATLEGEETHEQQEKTIRIRRTDYHYCSICTYLW